MPKAAFTSTDNRQMEIEYDTFGNPSHPALLMIMGYSAQMTAWPLGFIEAIVEHRPLRHSLRQPRLRPFNSS